jgi:hypothetical protein
MADDGTWAVSSVPLKYCVEREVEPHWTVEEAVNPDPLTVNVTAAPPSCRNRQREAADHRNRLIDHDRTLAVAVV